MPLEVAWRVMFRVDDAAAAERCLAEVLAGLTVVAVDRPRPYWKRPELWEAWFRTPFARPTAAGVLGLLRAADVLATGWLVVGPGPGDDRVTPFGGRFTVDAGRPHVAGLEWASFAVGEFPPTG